MAYHETKCPNCGLVTVFNDCRLQCYCINCGYLIHSDRVEKGSSEPIVSGAGPSSRIDGPAYDGHVSIIISAPKRPQPFTFLIDGNRVLTTTGGTYNVRTTAGRHSLTVRQSLFSLTEDADLSEGDRISVSVGVMGIRLNVDHA